MKKIFKLNIGVLISFLSAGYLVYYLLIYGNGFNTSISSIIDHSHNLAVKEHLVVLGLLPIYIAAMIFGAGVVGIYLGSALQHFFNRSKKIMGIKTPLAKKIN